MRNVDLDDEFDDEPPPYGATTEKREEEPEGCQKDYFYSAPGALKIVEAVLALIGFIATLATYFPGNGFVAWVTISTFIVTVVLFILKVLNIISRLPGYWELYELIYLIVYCVKFAVAVIVAAISATRSASVMAACVICAVAFLILVLDAVLAYRKFQEVRAEQQRAVAEGRATGVRRTGRNFCIIV